MKTKQTILLLLSMVLVFACKPATETKTNQSKTETVTKELKGQAAVTDNVSDPNALQKAKSIKDFSTLVAAIEAAGVQDAVVNAGPLTIFAPLNTAFEKLPQGTVETLLKPENKSKLAFILTNHVAPANYPVQQLKKEARKKRKLYMASGKYLVVEDKDGKLFIDGVEVLKTVKVSNGWIHVIDQVLVPAE